MTESIVEDINSMLSSDHSDHSHQSDVSGDEAIQQLCAFRDEIRDSRAFDRADLAAVEQTIQRARDERKADKSNLEKRKQVESILETRVATLQYWGDLIPFERYGALADHFFKTHEELRRTVTAATAASASSCARP